MAYRPNAPQPSGARKFRVGGSGFTVFKWQPLKGDSKVIAFARQVSHTSPAPVGPGPVPIQPLDARRPVEIITPAAISMGELVLELYELYNQRVWEQLSIIANSRDLAQIFRKVANTGHEINLVKVIKPPKGVSKSGTNASPQASHYQEVYHNAVITNVLDGEVIDVGTMEVLKQISVGYTHVTRPSSKGDHDDESDND